MSKLRKIYFVRLIMRCMVFVLCALMWFRKSAQLKVLKGMAFFENLTALHLLWFIWMMDMLCQLLPIKAQISLGSQKLFKCRFKPVGGNFDRTALKKYIVSTTKSAYLVFILWGVLAAVIGWLAHVNVLNDADLFMITVFFYVCDLICVVIWCPFRVLMGNRCCTTCRIFNWDHLMMFTPMIFVDGFFGRSLLWMSVLVWLVWELCVYFHPERFWEKSNEALRCSNCIDKLCTHFAYTLNITNMR